MEEKFDPKYKVHDPEEFQFGKILKVLWAEPLGRAGLDRSSEPSRISVRARSGDGTHVKVRRFVIIKTYPWHSVCLPILTYLNQGTSRRGIDPETHAIIYGTQQEPEPLPGERRELMLPSIACRMTTPRDKLDPTSRLQYAKLYTIEHNIRVWFIGRVATSHQAQLIGDYNAIHNLITAQVSVPHTEESYPTKNDDPDNGEGSWKQWSQPVTIFPMASKVVGGLREDIEQDFNVPEQNLEHHKVELLSSNSATPSPPESVISSLFSDMSASDSRSSHISDEVALSILHITKIFLDQSSFSQLCKTGFETAAVDSGKFANNIRRLIKSFALQLSVEQVPAAQLIATLILSNSGASRIAAQIRLEYDERYQEVNSRMRETHVEAISVEERTLRLQHFIHQTTELDKRARKARPVADIDSDASDWEEALDSDSAVPSVSLADIERLIPESSEFAIMVKSLEKLVNNHSAAITSRSEALDPIADDNFDGTRDGNKHVASRQKVPEQMWIDSYLKFSRIFVVENAWARLWHALPILPAGLIRVQYKCGCGKALFLDAREVEPDGITKLRMGLGLAYIDSTTKTSAVAARSNTGTSSVPNSLTTPAHVHLRDDSTMRPASANASHSSSSASTLAGATVPLLETRTAPTEKRFLLVCVKTRQLSVLVQVDLTGITEDNFSFLHINQAYEESRNKKSWNMGLIVPRYARERLPTAIDTWLQNLHLKVPQSADMVKFILQPYGTELCPMKQSQELPPEEQVIKHQTYHYEPCPAAAEILRIHGFNHLLRQCERPFKSYWTQKLPKKLKERLQDEPDVIGWGLIINETWNRALVGTLLLILIIVTSLIVVLYAKLARDPATAVGLGAFIMAIAMLVASVLWWSWEDRAI